jgi:hypothetical protein
MVVWCLERAFDVPDVSTSTIYKGLEARHDRLFSCSSLPSVRPEGDAATRARECG